MKLFVGLAVLLGIVALATSASGPWVDCEGCYLTWDIDDTTACLSVTYTSGGATDNGTCKDIGGTCTDQGGCAATGTLHVDNDCTYDVVPCEFEGSSEITPNPGFPSAPGSGPVDWDEPWLQEIECNTSLPTPKSIEFRKDDCDGDKKDEVTFWCEKCEEST